MSFTELPFLLLFLPLTFLLYSLCRRKWILQNTVLLVANLYFYYCYGLGNLLVLVGCILLTFAGGLLGSRALKQSPKKGSTILIGTAILNLCILLFFKYALFAVSSLNALLATFGGALPLPKIALPIGLSFFIFQSTSYLFDLKNGKTEPEQNPINYAVFVSFFPTVVSGPIQKSRDLLPKLRTERKITYTAFQRGVLVFLWGMFVKTVIADRIAVFTAEVFGSYAEHGGFTLALAAALYSIQIYADFSGYSYMAIGCGILFGFEMQDNFTQPYFAKSIVDFWRRWHISLTSWFREYLYFPLGGNRKGSLRKHLNVLIVFLVSGLWHGASWSFVLWGLVHAVFQITESLIKKPKERLLDKLKIDTSTHVYRVLQSLWVFFLTTFAWIFFRMPTVKDAAGFIKRMVCVWNPWVLFDRSLLELGLSAVEWNLLLCFLALLFAVSLLRERGHRADCIIRQKLPVRWLVYLLLIVSVVVFGIYGPGYSANNFIYAGF